LRGTFASEIVLYAAHQVEDGDSSECLTCGKAVAKQLALNDYD
jgi:hypothetical protein